MSAGSTPSSIRVKIEATGIESRTGASVSTISQLCDAALPLKVQHGGGAAKATDEAHAP